MHVVLFLKGNNILLPEFLGVTWTPSKLASFNLVSEFVDGAEHFLVGLKEFKESFKQFVDVLINPVAVLELDHKAQAVNVREVLLAHSVFLEVVEKHEHYSHELFPGEVVEDFGDLLDYSSAVVFEERMALFVVR